MAESSIHKSHLFYEKDVRNLEVTSSEAVSESQIDESIIPSRASTVVPEKIRDEDDDKLHNLHEATDTNTAYNTQNTSKAEVRKASKVLDLTDQTNLLPFRKVISVFAGLSVCILVSTLDTTLVATSLASISADFHAGSVSSFIPSTYLLASTAFQPLYGRFSDIFGRKLTLCLAMVVFVIGNLAAGFSRSIIEIIIFRGIAGAGGGGIVSLAQIIVSDVVSLRERGKYQGIIGVVVAFGNGVGPLLGGALSEKVSWRWCFWITLPLSLCAIVIVLYVLPLREVGGDIKRKLLAVDYIGTALTLSGCTLVMLPLIWGGITFSWHSGVVLATLVSGIFVVSLFCIWEWKGAKLPIVPMYIFKHSTVSGVYITMFVNGAIFNCSLYYIPQFFQISLGYSPLRAGVFLLPVLVSQTLASFISGVIVSRTGKYRAIIYIGFAVWAIGCGLLSTISANTSHAKIVIYMLISGVGGGQTLQTTTVAAQASVSRRDMSVVTAVRNFVRLLGGTLSLAIGSTIINNSLRSKMTSLKLRTSIINDIIDDPTLLQPLLTGSNATASDITITANDISPSVAFDILAGYTSGFRTLFVLNASLSAICVIVAIIMIRHKELLRGDEEEMRRAARENESKGYKKEAIDEIEMGARKQDKH